MKIVAIAVVAILYSLQAEASCNGEACDTLIPKNAPNQAADEPFPYEVDISSLAQVGHGFGYKPGESYRSKP